MPADCCVGSECYVQHPPQLVKTPTETEPETSSSIPEKENKKKASGNNASETVLRKKSRNASNLTKLIEKDEAFENRCRELIASKKKFGHCHVPQACPMKEAVTQRPQHMIKPPSKQILDVDHSTPSVSTAGNKAETADDEDVTENINHSADDYDIEVANNTQIDKLYTSPKIHERSNRFENREESSDSIDPLQDARVKSVIEHRQVDKTSTRSAGERRKPGNRDASAPQQRKKIRREKYGTTHSKTDRFDDWFMQLLQFKEANGHCNVPRRYSKNASLAKWCNSIRSAYKKIKDGRKSNVNLSQDVIERLENISFQ